MITITASGRLAVQPELKITSNGTVCEFRLLSTRYSKGEELTEAVTFFCFDEDAERFAQGTEKGQLIYATGVQETSHWRDTQTGASRTFVKYRMTWFEKGARARASRQHDGQEDNWQQGTEPSQARASFSSPAQRSHYQRPNATTPAQRPQQRPMAAQEQDDRFDDLSGQIPMV